VTALAAPAVTSPHLPDAGGGVDRAIRVSTAAVVLAVASIAAYISYWHAYAVVREYGESGLTAQLVWIWELAQPVPRAKASAMPQS
jgi:hypothetical protein